MAKLIRWLPIWCTGVTPVSLPSSLCCSAALEKVFAAMPAKEDGKADLAGGMNVTKLLPTKRSYWAFEGSLTTPPCSEATFCCAAQPDLQKFKLTAR
jgi:hypothetical protein